MKFLNKLIKKTETENNSKKTKSKKRKNTTLKNEKKKKSKDEKFREIIDKGGLRSRFIIEIVGKPFDHVDNVLEEIKTKIKSNYLVKTVKKFKPKEKDGVFHGFVEADVYFKDFEEFINFSFTFYPSSVEIVEPPSFSLGLNEFNSFFNDILLKLHTLGFELKKLKVENELLKNDALRLMKDKGMLIENIILLVLHLTKKAMSVEEIAKITGLQGNIKPFLENLMKKQRVVEENGNFMYNFSYSTQK